MLGWRDESSGRQSTDRAVLLPICCGFITHSRSEPSPPPLPAAAGTHPQLSLQRQPRRHPPRWSINNGNTHLSSVYLQRAWSSGQPLCFSETSTEPPSRDSLFTAQQTAHSPRSKRQGQRDHSPSPGNGAKVFALDLGRWSPPRWTPHAAGSRPWSLSSEKKMGSPQSTAKCCH